jgi:hypothetical protein
MDRRMRVVVLGGLAVLWIGALVGCDVTVIRTEDPDADELTLVEDDGGVEGLGGGNDGSEIGGGDAGDGGGITDDGQGDGEVGDGGAEGGEVAGWAYVVGQPTPTEAYEALARALTSRDWETIAKTTTPEGQAEFCTNYLTAVGFAHLDDEATLEEFATVLGTHTGYTQVVDASAVFAAMSPEELSALMDDMYDVAPATFDELIASAGTLGDVHEVGNCATAAITSEGAEPGVTWFSLHTSGWLVSAEGEGDCDPAYEGDVAFVRADLFPPLETALDAVNDERTMPNDPDWVAALPADGATVEPGDVAVAYFVDPRWPFYDTGEFRAFLVLEITDAGVSLMDVNHDVLHAVPPALVHKAADYTEGRSLAVGDPVLGIYWLSGHEYGRVAAIAEAEVTVEHRDSGEEVEQEVADVVFPLPTEGYVLREVAFTYGLDQLVGIGVAETADQVWMEVGMDVFVVDKADATPVEGIGGQQFAANSAVFVNTGSFGVIAGTITREAVPGLLYEVQTEYEWSEPEIYEYFEIFTSDPFTD